MHCRHEFSVLILGSVNSVCRKPIALDWIGLDWWCLPRTFSSGSGVSLETLLAALLWLFSGEEACLLFAVFYLPVSKRHNILSPPHSSYSHSYSYCIEVGISAQSEQEKSSK